METCGIPFYQFTGENHFLGHLFTGEHLQQRVDQLVRERLQTVIHRSERRGTAGGEHGIVITNNADIFRDAQDRKSVV